MTSNAITGKIHLAIDRLCETFASLWTAESGLDNLSHATMQFTSFLEACEETPGPSPRSTAAMINLVEELVCIDAEKRLRCGMEVGRSYYLQRLPGFDEAIAAGLKFASAGADETAQFYQPTPTGLHMRNATPADYSSTTTEDGRYQFIEKIGNGGCGGVYRAYDTRMKRGIAIKVAHESSFAALLEEQIVLAQITHPHVSQIHDVVPLKGDRCGSVMDLFKEDLQTKLKREGALDPREAADLVMKIADALDYVHNTLRLIHRDVKPGNIVLTAEGNPYLIDFGLAIQPEAVELVGGTVPYMAPEQLRGESIDKRVDVWALGVVLYECLTGSNPFLHKNLPQIEHAIFNVDPPTPYHPEHFIPPRLMDIVLKCLNKDPNERFASARKLFDALKPHTITLDVRHCRLFIERALLPAQFFQGRETLVDSLRKWILHDHLRYRVVALEAVGGTGKTAIVQKVIDSVARNRQFATFVWSFENNNQVELFFKTACERLGFDLPKNGTEFDEYLRNGLRESDAPHLFILDGLEKVQRWDIGGRGRLDSNSRLGDFLRWLASGADNCSRALITTQLPLPDLSMFDSTRFYSIRLDQLGKEHARQLLRDWNVRGTDHQIDSIVQAVNCHAGYINVLGSYLHEFHDGDINEAPTISRENSNSIDFHDTAIKDLATKYCAYLSPSEQALITRLSLFPRGARIDRLQWVADSNGETAGSLSGCDNLTLKRTLKYLEKLGLVFSAGDGGRTTNGHDTIYATVPFLQTHFGSLLDPQTAKRCFDVVRAKLEANVSRHPAALPRTTHQLDEYEELIDATRRAGHLKRAFDFYSRKEGGMGGEAHLSWTLGEMSRGLRIVEPFRPEEEPSPAKGGLSDVQRTKLLTGKGQFLLKLGKVSEAESAFEKHNEICLRCRSNRHYSRGCQHLAGLKLHSGHFPSAKAFALRAFDYATRIKRFDDSGRKFHPLYASMSLCYYATALSLLGEVQYARANFEDAAEFAKNVPPGKNSRPELMYISLTQWAEFLLLMGERMQAKEEALNNLKFCDGAEFNSVTFHNETLLGRCELPSDIPRATAHLAAARDYATQSGTVSIDLRCDLLQMQIWRFAGSPEKAVNEAARSIFRADEYGYGMWSMELRLELARIHIANNSPELAIEPAEWVRNRSMDPQCGYAWGLADSSHLLGVAFARIGGSDNRTKARAYLSEALSTRRRIWHPEAEETKLELHKIDG